MESKGPCCFTLCVVRGQAEERLLLGGLGHPGIKDGGVHKQATDSPESAVGHGVTTQFCPEKEEKKTQPHN